jgi:hypothetical protein
MDPDKKNGRTAFSGDKKCPANGEDCFRRYCCMFGCYLYYSEKMRDEKSSVGIALFNNLHPLLPSKVVFFTYIKQFVRLNNLWKAVIFTS